MYDIYIDDMLLPINPEKITMKINGKNETATLINDGEVSILKSPGLTDVSFNLLLPNQRYPFIHYSDKANTFHDAKYYLDKLKVLKEQKVAFQFIITRRFPRKTNSRGIRIFNTNITCSLESFSIIDDAKNGFDIEVQIVMKQYKPYSTKTFHVEKPSPRAPIVVNPQRGASTSSGKNKKGKSGSKGGKGGKGGGTKTYKVCIPGMSTLSIKASSVQEAIKKAAGTWTGDIMVDGKTYYVKKGVISEKAAKKTNPPAAVKKVVDKVVTGVKKVVSTVKSVVSKVVSAVRKTTPSPVKKISGALSKLVKKN